MATDFGPAECRTRAGPKESAKPMPIQALESRMRGPESADRRDGATVSRTGRHAPTSGPLWRQNANRCGGAATTWRETGLDAGHTITAKLLQHNTLRTRIPVAPP